MRVSVIILFWFLITYSNSVWGQKEDFIGKSQSQQIEYVRGIYQLIEKDTNLDSLINLVNDLEASVNPSEAQNLWLELSYLKLYLLTHEKKVYPEDHRDLRAKIFEIARQTDNWAMLAKMEELEAGWYWNIDEYEQAFGHWYRMLEYTEYATAPIDKNFINGLHRLARGHYFFGDYRQAIKYFKQLLRELESNPNEYFELQANNTLGMCYRKLSVFDTSNYYFRQTEILAGDYDRILWKGLAKGNLGYNFYLTGDLERAIPLIKEDFEISLAHDGFQSAAFGAILLANISLERNESFEKIEQWVRKATECTEKCGYPAGVRKDYYPMLSKYYARKGDYELSGRYLDSTLFLKDSLSMAYSKLQILRAKQKIEIEKSNTQIAKVRLENKTKTVQRNAVFAVFILVCILGGYIFINRRNQYRKEQIIKDAQLKEQKAALELAEKKLYDYARSFSQTNAIIDRLKKQTNYSVSNNDAEISLLYESTILTDEDWDEFRSLFEKVYPGFMTRLKTDTPGLSATETRFVALSKMNLSVKEMSGMLGVSQNAIYKTKSRLKNKLGFEDNSYFDQWIKDF